jgi:hypothetical protein
MVEVAVTGDPAAAHAASVEAGALYATLPSYRRVLDLEGVDSGADLLLAGSIGRIVDGLGEYVDAGVTELRLCIGSSDPGVVRATRDALAELLAG